ncbi:MAG: SDR family NAD(P)-dependent oxidoreductase [Phycisphaerae bacterium]|jgi:short-subunit dehydrogenase|nr:SDR family NAD(P)-dependent oxidoreductase [Phycisphaerae bacterium]
MSIPLEGKTILITGASSGIGAATARACIAAGMKCVITARREDRLKTLCTELGGSCSYIAGDVTEEGFNQHLLDESGEVYAIFANAGHGLDQKIVDNNMEQFKELFRLNVFSAVELASLATKEMVKRKSGHIILNASCLSKFSVPHNSAYCGSKAAVEAIAKSMRIELKKNKVFVSTVHPIGTKTEFFKESSSRSGTEFSDFEKNSPAWLMQSPEKVADAVVRCLRRPKPEVWTSLPMRLISTLFTAFPRASGVTVNKFS